MDSVVLSVTETAVKLERLFPGLRCPGLWAVAILNPERSDLRASEPRGGRKQDQGQTRVCQGYGEVKEKEKAAQEEDKSTLKMSASERHCGG